MVNIGQIQLQTGPRPTSAENGRPEPMGPSTDPKAEAVPGVPETGPAKRGDSGRTDPVDPEQIRDFLSRVAEAMDQAMDGPHLVGFRMDPDTGRYLVEVRSPDGEVVKTLDPEIFLNRHPNPDELTGMLVDSRS